MVPSFIRPIQVCPKFDSFIALRTKSLGEIFGGVFLVFCCVVWCLISVLRRSDSGVICCRYCCFVVVAVVVAWNSEHNVLISRSCEDTGTQSL